MISRNGKSKVALNHGPLTAKAYDTWVHMRRRCNRVWPKGNRNEIYNNVSCEFHTFERFLVEVGIPTDAKLSIDRIDGTKGYVPGNIRWANAATQRRNCSNTKLSFKMAEEIRAEYGLGGSTLKAIAQKHGVHETLISAVVRNKVWQQVS